MRGVAQHSGSGGERGRLAGQRGGTRSGEMRREIERERERKETHREKRRRGAAPREGSGEKGKNERGGETGKRDEAEIQKVLTS